MLDLLSSTVIQSMPVINNPYSLNFIGQFIQWLIESLPSVGLGIIAFTLVLKLITLPLDIISRVSMKKNNLKMERLRPQLEKLQRQYANNKEIYNQKIQSLYKKEGYSALSSCLPTIVTLIVFIIVINQFSNYSNYANLTLIEGMVNSYNAAIETYDDTYKTDVVIKVGNEYQINMSSVISDETLSEAGVTAEKDETTGQYTSFVATDITKFAEYVKTLNDEGYTGVTVGTADTDILYDEASGTYSFNSVNYSEEVTTDDINKELATKVFTDICQDEIENVKEVAREAAAIYYRENVPSFLWVKNIWVEDLPWKHPVKSSFSEYNFTIRSGCSSESAGIEINDENYAELTANLSEEKSQPNGYLILVVLSIGIMVLSTLISNKTQKAQMELQTADGAAAQSSKMMMWMMPVMFGIFAFIYTASFSIYMVVSSAVSTASTVIINKIVEKRFAKKMEAELYANDKRYRKSPDTSVKQDKKNGKKDK